MPLDFIQNNTMQLALRLGCKGILDLLKSINAISSQVHRNTTWCVIVTSVPHQWNLQPKHTSNIVEYVDTDIIASITASPKQRASCVTSNNVYIKTFKADVQFLIGNVVHVTCWRITDQKHPKKNERHAVTEILLKVALNTIILILTLTEKFQYQNKFVDNIPLKWDQRKNVLITGKRQC